MRTKNQMTPEQIAARNEARRIERARIAWSAASKAVRPLDALKSAALAFDGWRGGTLRVAGDNLFVETIAAPFRVSAQISFRFFNAERVTNPDNPDQFVDLYTPESSVSLPGTSYSASEATAFLAIARDVTERLAIADAILSRIRHIGDVRGVEAPEAKGDDAEAQIAALYPDVV